MPKNNLHFPLVLVKELGVREELAILLRYFVNIYFRPPDLLVPNLLSPFGEALVSSAEDLSRHDNEGSYSRLMMGVSNQKIPSQNEGHWNEK